MTRGGFSHPTFKFEPSFSWLTIIHIWLVLLKKTIYLKCDYEFHSTLHEPYISRLHNLWLVHFARLLFKMIRLHFSVWFTFFFALNKLKNRFYACEYFFCKCVWKNMSKMMISNITFCYPKFPNQQIIWKLTFDRAQKRKSKEESRRVSL